MEAKLSVRKSSHWVSRSTGPGSDFWQSVVSARRWLGISTVTTSLLQCYIKWLCSTVIPWHRHGLWWRRPVSTNIGKTCWQQSGTLCLGHATNPINYDSATTWWSQGFFFIWPKIGLQGRGSHDNIILERDSLIVGRLIKILQNCRVIVSDMRGCSSLNQDILNNIRQETINRSTERW